MRRSVRLFGPHFCHLPSHQQPACAALTLLGCSKQTTLLLGNGNRTYSQPATSENHAVGDGQPEDVDFKLMQAVLSRVGPPPEMREAHRTNDVSRIRFGDLPATANWMESFVGSGSSGGYSASGNPGPQSGDAIYDIPAWLQANVPAHDTTPKSPLYHWVSWMNENLPQDQRRLYLALHEHLQHEPRRQAIMAKAQFELACLWDWQHRRVAAGLPPEWTQQEQEAARSAILAESEKEARSLQTSAAAARARAASEASVAAGGQPTLIPSSSSSSSSATRGKGKAGSHGIQPGGVSAPAANSPIERMAAGVRAGTAEAEAAVADAQRWLIQDPSNSAMLPDMHAALQQAHEAAARCSAAAAAGDVKTFEQSANLAERAGGMAQRIAAAVAPHLVGAGGHNEAAAALEATKARSKAELRSKEGGKGPKEEGPLSGMSLFLKRAEHREEEAEKERKERMLKLSQHLGLNRREQALIHALDLDPGLLLQHRAAGTASASEQAVGGSRSSGSPGLQPLLSTFMARLESGKKHMAAGGGGSRAVALMRSQSEARAREEAELADALSLTGAAERPTPPPGSGNSAALKTKRAPLGSRELAAQAQAALQRAREARQQQTAQEKQQGAAKAQLQAEAGSLAVSEGGVDKLTWSQLAAFNHESTLGRMADRRHDRELVVQRKLLADNQVLDLGSPPPYSPDPLYRSPYRFSLGVRPPTATLDLVLDYMQVKYQDVLLRRDLTQRVWAELAPRTPAADPFTKTDTDTTTTSTTPSTPSSPVNPGGASSSTAAGPLATRASSSSSDRTHVSSSPSSLSVTPRSTPGHWSGRLSQVEVAALNARAEQLFQEGRAQPYMALMQELAQQGLLSEVELAEHATAVSLRERELAVEQGVHAPAAASDATSGAAAAAVVGPQLKAHLLAGLTGEGSSAVGGFGTARSFGVLEEARAAWEGAWPAAGPSAQSPSGGASTAPQGSESLSYPAWAAAMAEEAAAAQYRQPTLSTPASAGSAAATGANQGGDQQQRQQQLQQVARAWWQGQGAVAPSFEEARTAWQQYVEMAGCPAHAPLLEDIITADTELRAARAAVRAAAREATRAALPALSRDSEGSSEEGDAPAKERLLAAQQRADHLNASIADLFRSFVARNGTATAPIGPAAHTGAHSPPSPATTHGDTSSNVRSNVSSSSINPESAWGAISARNKALNPLLVGNNTKAAGSSSLLSIFKGSLTVPEMLRGHWEAVGRAFLRTNLAWSSAPAWDQLWSLMTTLHKSIANNTTTSTSASTKSSDSSTGASAASGGQATGGAEARRAKASPPPPYAAAGLSPASRELLSKLGKGGEASGKTSAKDQEAPSPAPAAGQRQQQQQQHTESVPRTPDGADTDAGLQPEFLAAAGPAAPAPPEDTAAQAAAEAARREEERSRQWNKYLQTQRKHAESEAAQGQAWPVSAQVAPPYPGARPIVRFQQSIILGPASALTSSQGLAERLAAREASDAAHPATLGLGSPPVMLPDHPSSKRVTMKVKMSELAEEMGLSGSAVEYMKLVAGRSRYDPMTDDLTLVCSTHPTREENRRWCLERVHILAAEAHSVSTVDKPLKGLAKWE